MAEQETALAAERWDEEYRQGRYRDEPPLPFVRDILATLGAHPAIRAGVGLYVGCGNGRNYLPLIDAGLTLHGLDLSAEALRQLAERRPAVAPMLVHGDLASLARPQPVAYVIALQVLQHGGEVTVRQSFARVADLLTPGGLFFVRVNAVSTQVYHKHVVTEEGMLGGRTIRYLDGPKRDLSVHFFSREELSALTGDAFEEVLPPREDITQRTAPASGFWSQWEAIWRRR